MELDLLQIAQKPDWKEMIYSIVKKERMDPWAIDIGLLTRRFIEKIKMMKALNLRVPANAILAASILLRFKSNTLKFYEEEDGDENEEEKVEYLPPVQPVGRIKYRGITLDELIKALEIAMEKEKKKKRRNVVKIVPEQLLVIAEGENFEEKAEEFFQKLKKKGFATFDELLEKRTKNEVVNNLFCALHLANQERIDMWQEEFFGDIFLKVRE